jgi:hypothetical protein
MLKPSLARLVMVLAWVPVTAVNVGDAPVISVE